MILNYDSRLKRPKFWHQLKDFTWEVSQLGFAFFPNNFFLKIAEKAVQHLTSAGIMFWSIENEIGVTYKFLTRKEPKRLTVQNLNFGFMIWLGFCGLSFMTFVGEVLYAKLKKLIIHIEIRTLKQLELKVRPVKIIKNVKRKRMRLNNVKQLKISKPLMVRKIMVVSAKRKSIGKAAVG